MQVELSVPYLDTTASQLRLGVGCEGGAALAELHLVRPFGEVWLRVLGGSHEARLATDAGELVEVVACGVTGGVPLPGHHTEVAAAGHYQFTSRVHALAPEEFDRSVDDLQRALADRSDAVVAVFPGDARAVTALALDEAGWTTWHTYPRTGELVRTSSRVERRRS